MTDALTSGQGFADCQALCDAGAACASFEYRWSDATCHGSLISDPCTGANTNGGKSSPGFTCVPTPSHVPARVRCLRSFRLRSHAPGPPADARALPFTHQLDAHTRRPPDSPMRAEACNLTIVLWCVRGRLSVKLSFLCSTLVGMLVSDASPRSREPRVQEYLMADMAELFSNS